MLDRISVGAVGRQANEGGATGLDGVAHTGDLVTAEIVQDDDIARPKRRREHLLDLGAEDVAVDGAVDDQWRGEAVGAQAGNEGRGFPVPVRDRRNQPLSRRRAPIPPRHIGGGPGLVDEDQPVGV